MFFKIHIEIKIKHKIILLFFIILNFSLLSMNKNNGIRRTIAMNGFSVNKKIEIKVIL